MERKHFLTLCGWLACLSWAGSTASADTLSFANAFNYLYDSVDNTFPTFSQYTPNGAAASANGGGDGITLSSSANLQTGILKIYNAGSGSSGIDAASEATIGDTITAQGSTGGFNLGVNITVGGTITDSTYTNNNTFLVVDILPVGAFDQSNYFSDILYSAIYILGPDTTPSYGWQSYGSSIDGTYPSGTNVIPLNIPFDDIGTNFQIFIALESYEIGTSGVWSTDYTDPFDVSLSAPNGVTLNSAGGIAGTIAATPEPGTFGMMITAMAGAGLGLLKRSKRG